MPPPLIIATIFIKDAHNAESNEKSFIRIFRFLVFELWPIVLGTGDTWFFKCVTDQQKKIRSKVIKFTENMCNMLKRIKNEFSDF